MPLVRVLPPADGLHSAITVNGRSYTCAVGSVIDVPDCDALVMTHNGWTLAAGSNGGALAAVAATVARPTNPAKGQQFLDTTVGAIIVWDGKVWRSHVTGAAV